MSGNRPQNICIRAAGEEDLPVIGQLWLEMMLFHQDALSFALAEDALLHQRTYMAQRLTADDTKVVVADAGGQVVGYCRAHRAHHPPVYASPAYGMVAELIVSQEWRRQGIGEKLYNEARTWFVRQGLTSIEVGTATRNTVSNAFWGKLGFQSVREVKRCAL